MHKSDTYLQIRQRERIKLKSQSFDKNRINVMDDRIQTKHVFNHCRL